MYVHFGWNPVVFFLALVVSLGLAYVLKKVSAAWLLPAIVLYFGLDWDLPGVWSLLIKLGFWLAVIVVLVTMVLPIKTLLAKAPLVLISGVLVLGALGNAWGWLGDTDGEATPVVITESPGTPTADTPPSGTCVDQFAQRLDPNRKYRFVSDGFEGTSNEKRQQLIDKLGHDYRYLDFFAEQLFHKSIDEKALYVGDCLSAEGQSLHAEVKGALMASGVKKGKASSNSYNTGMEDGKAVVSEDRGIDGNRSATMYTLTDGTEVVVLDRCGNIALPSPPKNLPPGKTDNPPPPEKEKPPPGTPKCPPGQVGTPPNCLTPKSSNPRDYPYPVGKPKSEAKTPGESKPPKVETSKPGGGGVTDSPTKPPGSETGGQAGGGATKPNPTRTPPPPEAGGGTNDGTVGE